MQPSHADPLSSSVEMGGALPGGGFVMELTTVVMELMNCLQHAVSYYIIEDVWLSSTLKIKKILNTYE